MKLSGDETYTFVLLIQKIWCFADKNLICGSNSERSNNCFVAVFIDHLAIMSARFSLLFSTVNQIKKFKVLMLGIFLSLCS